MALTIMGTGSIFDLCEDRIIYRSLDPLDLRLPRFKELKTQISLTSGSHPRKSDPEYGVICATYIRRMAELQGNPEPENLLYFGDTLFNDGSAFNNILSAGEWNGAAFIGSDLPGKKPELIFNDRIGAASRWNMLESFLGQVAFPLDSRTVLVVDLDKTALGARGRNDSIINEARIEAMQQTIQSALHGEMDESLFRTVYDTLNQIEFHPFTGDNQDYLAYLCLIVIGSVLDLQILIDGIHSGHFSTFPGFLETMQQKRPSLAARGLENVHDTVWQAVRQGDPTPFKAFRKAEFVATLNRFTTNQNQPVEEVLKKYITLTGEVYQASRKLQQQGVVVLGISDKPDLSSVPDEKQIQSGLMPIHKAQTLILGEEN